MSRVHTRASPRAHSRRWRSRSGGRWHTPSWPRCPATGCCQAETQNWIRIFLIQWWTEKNTDTISDFSFGHLSFFLSILAMPSLWLVALEQLIRQSCVISMLVKPTRQERCGVGVSGPAHTVITLFTGSLELPQTGGNKLESSNVKLVKAELSSGVPEILSEYKFYPSWFCVEK